MAQNVQSIGILYIKKFYSVFSIELDPIHNNPVLQTFAKTFPPNILENICTNCTTFQQVEGALAVLVGQHGYQIGRDTQLNPNPPGMPQGYMANFTEGFSYQITRQ